MARWILGVAGLALVIASLAAGTAGAQTADPGRQVFEARCKSCHEPAIERAPSLADLARRPKADVLTALTVGIMKPMAGGLTPAELDAVSAYVTTGAPPASAGRRDAEMPQIAIKGGAVGTDPPCQTQSPLRAGPGDWASMGVDDASTRFQRRPGLAAADVPRLKLKWAFSMTGGGQPTVVGDWLFVTNRSGKFYALDARTGCVRWARSDVVARTTPMVVKSAISPSGWATFVGVADHTVRAFDAQDGKPIWTSPVLEDHPATVMTGTPIVAGGRLIVPISSIEEAAAMSKTYACCTFRGSLAALDIKSGALMWKTFTISEPRKVIREKDSGLKVGGPAGAAIWGAPSVDQKRGLVYVVTGDSYTDVDTIGADAVMAIEVATGKIRWQHQVTKNDNFVMGCGRKVDSGNCPTPLGPDFDFGATPVLVPIAGGKQVLVAGQKSGYAHGFDPVTGKRLWSTQVGVGSALGGIEWGIGADDKRVYVPVSDLGAMFAPGPNSTARPGLNALDPATGKVLWSTPAPQAPCTYLKPRFLPGRCFQAQSAAPAIIPGFVFQGALDGWFRAYDSATGKIVWEVSTTAQTYDTVNGIRGQPGGGIDGMGPTVAGGMVFITSGNNGAAGIGSNGVNVLLAYSVDGK